MEISASNIIINYFLLHNDIKTLSYAKLTELIDKIQTAFHVSVVGIQKKDIQTIQHLCSDFIIIDDDGNIYQNNILDYLQELQPVYQWISFRKWKYEQDYYNLIKNFE